MNNGALVLGFLMCAVGLVAGWVLWNPWGFVLDGLGIMIFFYGIFAKEEETTPTQEEFPQDDIVDGKVSHSDQMKRCGHCIMWGLESCPRHEFLFGATACDKFLPRR